MAQLKLVPFSKGAKNVHTKLNANVKKQVASMAKKFETKENHVINSILEAGIKAMKGRKELSRKK